jgi:hypothetical protein
MERVKHPDSEKAGPDYAQIIPVSASSRRMPLHHVLMPQAIFVADAYRDDEKRFYVRADEKLTAFLELESAIANARDRS